MWYRTRQSLVVPVLRVAAGRWPGPKAGWSAVAFRRPTKAFQDAVAGGPAGVRVLALEGASPIEGGLPLLVDGKIVGAIGVSGVTGEQDSIVAAAGVAALK